MLPRFLPGQQGLRAVRQPWHRKGINPCCDAALDKLNLENGTYKKKKMETNLALKDRQTDRQTDRQIDTDRQTQTETEKTTQHENI